ncbi:MAG: TonB-dependent receptor family protein [Hyphomicrobiaceae bacterium]
MLIALAPRMRRLMHTRNLSIITASFLTALAVVALCRTARAQSPVTLPPVMVETAKPRVKAKAAPKAANVVPAPRPQPMPPAPAQVVNQTAARSSDHLTAPTTAQAEANLARVPGAVSVVSDTAYRSSTPAANLKDVLDYVPGVFVQPKWGEDSRLSIRGSGLSRNFHLRGLQLYMDGIPINTADGYGDLQEIDPSAYRYVEVYKGANALRYGANSVLGGAINFATPTGRDANLFSASADFGSFGYHRLQSSSGGARGPFDFFVTGSWQEADGYRDHAWGDSTRGSANLGFRVTPDIETRFYLNANHIRQRIPGSVTRDIALNSPTTAATSNVLLDQQRNIDSWRLANKTAFRLSPNTIVEAGIFTIDRHLMHPIFQWLDYQYDDYGGFSRLTDERVIDGFKNRLIAGLNLHNGVIDNQQFTNLPGAVKGALQSSSIDKSENLSAYVENSFFFLPDVALVTGTQFLYAVRERTDRYLSDPAPSDDSGRKQFDVWSPKIGLLWDVRPDSQVFANISRSGEVPSFSENTFTSFITSSVKEQTATTYEIGTRGRRPDYTWDLAAYRAEIQNELQCLTIIPGSCDVRNADSTVHQGVEIGFGVSVLKAIIASIGSPDRLWLNVAYTLNDFHFDDDAQFGNNILPGAPRYFLRSELLYKHPSGVFLGPNIEWVPQAYYVDNENTTRTVPYTLWGLKLGYDNGGPFSAYIEGRNLSDERYIASASITGLASPTSALFEPGTGRAVYAGIRYKW